jgi:hypothetical protein
MKLAGKGPRHRHVGGLLVVTRASEITAQHSTEQQRQHQQVVSSANAPAPLQPEIRRMWPLAAERGSKHKSELHERRGEENILG